MWQNHRPPAPQNYETAGDDDDDESAENENENEYRYGYDDDGGGGAGRFEEDDTDDDEPTGLHMLADVAAEALPVAPLGAGGHAPHGAGGHAPHGAGGHAPHGAGGHAPHGAGGHAPHGAGGHAPHGAGGHALQLPAFTADECRYLHARGSHTREEAQYKKATTLEDKQQLQTRKDTTDALDEAAWTRLAAYFRENGCPERERGTDHPCYQADSAVPHSCLPWCSFWTTTTVPAKAVAHSADGPLLRAVSPTLCMLIQSLFRNTRAEDRDDTRNTTLEPLRYRSRLFEMAAHNHARPYARLE
jgi:hypothetical protein